MRRTELNGVEPSSGQVIKTQAHNGIIAISWLVEAGGCGHWRLVLRELQEQRPWPKTEKAK